MDDVIDGTFNQSIVGTSESSSVAESHGDTNGILHGVSDSDKEGMNHLMAILLEQ